MASHVSKFGTRNCAHGLGGFVALLAAMAGSPVMAQGDDPLWNTAPCSPLSYHANCNPVTGAFSFPGRMADPTLLKVVDGNGVLWFYVTGTSDDDGQLNFPLYRSKDLRTWTLVKYAFPPNYDTSPNQLVLNGGTSQERRLRDLWSPHLFVDPSEEALGDNRNIYLAFTAGEIRPGINYDVNSNNRTVMIATISKFAFLNTGTFASPALSRGHEPIWYSYQVDNAGPAMYDGGYAQGQAEGTPRSIPVTINPYLEGPNCGNTYRISTDGFGWAHGCVGANTAMADAPFVYFAPSWRSNKRWMIYNWNAITGGMNTFDGDHVAAYPMRDNFTMEGGRTWTTRHLPLAYRYNTNTATKPDGVLPNGAVDGAGNQWKWMVNGSLTNAGVAEGGAAFHHNADSRYFVLYTRNTWDSPAYQIVYRSSTVSFENLALKDALGNRQWDNSTTAENVLAASNWVRTYNSPSTPPYTRDLNRNNNFGHGEVFYAWGRPYLIFHAKLDFSGERRIYFKELTINGATIERLFDGHSNQAYDLNYFLAPSCP